MQKDGKFIDPPLGANRFDYNGAPLSEEDFKKEEERREKEGPRKIPESEM